MNPSGQAVDGTILLGDHHVPLAVKESYFDLVCPSPVVINLPELQDVSSTDLVDIWTDILTTNNESCLQYPKINGPIFTRQLYVHPVPYSSLYCRPVLPILTIG